MSLITILETLLIGPLKLVFEIIFQLANNFIGHPGLAIIVLSLIMNILVLPLYKRADAMQEQARDVENKLHDGVAHIKKTFSGDERMMILQTYYRQNNYKPTDALNGSVSLLLEIPFFMAAYQFLSHLEILNGISLGPIQDLGAPDGLLVIGSLTLNLLPILMTTINVISSALYLKGFPLKTKIQLYGMALFFLVFLYKSPSCLVFYWTLNNVFSLVKTIFYKLRNPRKVLRIMTSVIGLAFLAFGACFYSPEIVSKKVFIIVLGLLLQLPLISPVLASKLPKRSNTQDVQPNRKIFTLGSLFLTVLVGLLIPSTFIAASPQEYVDVTYFHNPLWYIVSSTSLAAGFFLVWMGVFYWLATPKGKVMFNRIVWILCGAMLVNYMFFGTDLGIISANLQYLNGFTFSVKEQLLNALVLVVVALAMYFVIKKWERFLAPIILTMVIALGGMSVLHLVTIKDSVNQVVQVDESQAPNFSLSTSGQNVVVIMLDRAVGEYLPYIMNERPELEEQFAGFTYYSNTISFGYSTNLASPALMGGYEYTPVEMNKRSTEPLASKHNEALLLMPVIFDQNDYDVTVFDPVCANYQWAADLTVFDDYPEIESYVSDGYFGDTVTKQNTIDNAHRNFFCFSLMKSMPVSVQPLLYDNGRYNKAESSDNMSSTVQVTEDMHRATGIYESFMESYNVLVNLDQMTQITDGDTNTYMFMVNNTVHEPMILQEPEYIPAINIDNTAYDTEHADRFTLNGRTLVIEDAKQMMNYQAQMAALIQLGNWFDYLRENGVYDNTKIIIAADHGYNTYSLPELMIGEYPYWETDVENYFPLLLVKDFNSTEFTTSHEFMTNADVPTLAFKDLIENPVNPFTGKIVNNAEKTAHDQIVTLSLQWDIMVNNGNTFLPSGWASVKNDLWNPNNWTFSYDEIVLDSYVLPQS